MIFMNTYQRFVNESKNINYRWYMEYGRDAVDTSVVLNLTSDDKTRDLFKNDVSTGDVKFLNKYLRDNSHKLIELYHGTSSSNNILGDGLLTTTNKTKRSYQSETGYVYLSLYEDTARTFGSLAYGGGDVTVYKVTIPVYFLKADMDQLRNVRQFKGVDVGDSLAESALYGHGFRVKGNIPPVYIKKVL